MNAINHQEQIGYEYNINKLPETDAIDGLSPDTVTIFDRMKSERYTTGESEIRVEFYEPNVDDILDGIDVDPIVGSATGSLMLSSIGSSFGPPEFLSITRRVTVTDLTWSLGSAAIVDCERRILVRPTHGLWFSMIPPTRATTRSNPTRKPSFASSVLIEDFSSYGIPSRIETTPIIQSHQPLLPAFPSLETQDIPSRINAEEH